MFTDKQTHFEHLAICAMWSAVWNKMKVIAAHRRTKADETWFLYRLPAAGDASGNRATIDCSWLARLLSVVNTLSYRSTPSSSNLRGCFKAAETGLNFAIRNCSMMYFDTVFYTRPYITIPYRKCSQHLRCRIILTTVDWNQSGGPPARITFLSMEQNFMGGTNKWCKSMPSLQICFPLICVRLYCRPGLPRIGTYFGFYGFCSVVFEPTCPQHAAIHRAWPCFCCTTETGNLSATCAYNT